MKIIAANLAIALLCTNASAIAAPSIETPKLPYYDWGACPFECCTYRDWKTTDTVNLVSQPSAKSTSVAQIGKGLSVTGMTGVVITSQYGITRIVAPLNVGFTSTSKAPQLSLKPGDVVYTLHYAGEAYDLFWYNGQVYSDQISEPENAWGDVPNHDAVKIVSRPKYEWWVKVKTANGQIGWTNQTDHFSNMDACA